MKHGKEIVMQEEIKDLLYSVVAGEAAESQEKLNSIMMAKTAIALDQLRLDTAKTMFNGKEQE